MTREEMENHYRKEENEMLIRRFVGHVGYDYIEHHKKQQHSYILISQRKLVSYGKKLKIDCKNQLQSDLNGINVFLS